MRCSSHLEWTYLDRDFWLVALSDWYRNDTLATTKLHQSVAGTYGRQHSVSGFDPIDQTRTRTESKEAGTREISVIAASVFNVPSLTKYARTEAPILGIQIPKATSFWGFSATSYPIEYIIKV